MAIPIKHIKDNNNVNHNIIGSGVIRATVDTENSTTTNFILSAPEITELFDGLTLIFTTPKAAAAGLTITLNNFAAKNIYNSLDHSATKFASKSNMEVTIVYDSSLDSGAGGFVWQVGWYGEDADTIGESAGYCQVGPSGWYVYNIAMQVEEGIWESVTLSGGTSSKTANPHGFLVSSTMAYQSTKSYVEGESVTKTLSWICGSGALNTRYIAQNYSTSWSTVSRPLYFKGTITGNKFYLVESNWLVDALPTIADGYYYWYIGQMQDAYRYTLLPYHPIYYHNGEMICQYLPCIEENTSIIRRKQGRMVSLDDVANGNNYAKECIVSLNSEIGYTKANVYIGHNENICGGTVLRNEIMAGISPVTADDVAKTVTFASSASNVKRVAKGIFKQGVQYTFIFTLYKNAGSGTNLRVYYTDGSNENFPTVSATKTKVTVIYTSIAGKTIDGIAKVTNSGNTTLYYDESGIFEGVLTAQDFVAYVGDIVTVDFNSNTVYTGELNITEGILRIDDTTPSTYVYVNPANLYLYDIGINNIFADCGDIDITYIKSNNITDAIYDYISYGNYEMSASNMVIKADANSPDGADLYGNLMMQYETKDEGEGSESVTREIVTIHSEDGSEENVELIIGNEFGHAIKDWKYIDDTGFDSYNVANSLVLDLENINASELLIEVSVTSISGDDCYIQSHILPLANGGSSAGPSAKNCIFGGYYYNTSYFMNYALEYGISNGELTISWRNGWFNMTPSPSTSTTLYNIKVFAR